MPVLLFSQSLIIFLCWIYQVLLQYGFCIISKLEYSLKAQTESPLKMMKSLKKLFPYSRYLNFCLNFFGHAEKQLDEKDKVNFKIYDVTIWEAENRKTHIPQYLKK